MLLISCVYAWTDVGRCPGGCENAVESGCRMAQVMLAFALLAVPFWVMAGTTAGFFGEYSRAIGTAESGIPYMQVRLHAMSLRLVTMQVHEQPTTFGQIPQRRRVGLHSRTCVRDVVGFSPVLSVIVQEVTKLLLEPESLPPSISCLENLTTTRLDFEKCASTKNFCTISQALPTVGSVQPYALRRAKELLEYLPALNFAAILEDKGSKDLTSRMRFNGSIWTLESDLGRDYFLMSAHCI